jgi:osmoprotectant transport system permease protein
MRVSDRGSQAARLAAALAILAATCGLALFQPFWEWALGLLFHSEASLLYPRATLAELVGEHARLVGISSGLAVLVGIPLGVWVTRPAGQDFRLAVDDLGSLAQSFPPVAVLALAVPVLGFGAPPTLVALTLFSILPIVRNTVRGLEGVPEGIREAARGLGMSPSQVLWRVELPLSLSVILAGVRIAVVVDIGTATIGAVAGAGGLGRPIMAGLTNERPAYVVEGAVVAALLAYAVDLVLSSVERLASRPGICAA